MTATIEIVGGSRDGARIPTTLPGGREIVFTFRSSTGEVWLRDTHGIQGDRLYFAEDVEYRDGVLCFESIGEVEDDRGASA